MKYNYEKAKSIIWLYHSENPIRIFIYLREIKLIDGELNIEHKSEH